MKTREPSSQYMRMSCYALYTMFSSAEVNDSIMANRSILLYNEIRARDRPFAWLLNDKEASMILYSALQKYDVERSPIPNSGGVWTNMMKELANVIPTILESITDA